MPLKRRIPVPREQLTLIDIEPEPPREKKPKVKRIDSLEERVTRLEGDLALTKGQLDREVYEYDDDGDG